MPVRLILPLVSRAKDTYTSATSGTTWTKPGVLIGTTITAKCWGAGGGGTSGPDGGGGGFVQGDIDVSGVSTLSVRVGGAGGAGAAGAAGGGGGYSGIFDGSTAKVVAGGGGGAGGGSTGGAGGAGGGTTGGAGAAGSGGSGPGNGGGGGQSGAGGAGGTGGSTASDGAAGASLAGGAGGNATTDATTGGGANSSTNGGAAGGTIASSDGGGGGGGGGYYGGGGGEGSSGSGSRMGGGGGGGSNYVGGATNTTNTQASGATVANGGDADYGGGAGAGATASNSAGGAGRVVLIYDIVNPRGVDQPSTWRMFRRLGRAAAVAFLLPAFAAGAAAEAPVASQRAAQVTNARKAPLPRPGYTLAKRPRAVPLAPDVSVVGGVQVAAQAPRTRPRTATTVVQLKGRTGPWLELASRPEMPLVHRAPVERAGDVIQLRGRADIWLELAYRPEVPVVTRAPVERAGDVFQLKGRTGAPDAGRPLRPATWQAVRRPAYRGLPSATILVPLLTHEAPHPLRRSIDAQQPPRQPHAGAVRQLKGRPAAEGAPPLRRFLLVVAPPPQVHPPLALQLKGRTTPDPIGRPLRPAAWVVTPPPLPRDLRPGGEVVQIEGRTSAPPDGRPLRPAVWQMAQRPAHQRTQSASFTLPTFRGDVGPSERPFRPILTATLPPRAPHGPALVQVRGRTAAPAPPIVRHHSQVAVRRADTADRSGQVRWVAAAPFPWEVWGQVEVTHRQEVDRSRGAAIIRPPRQLADPPVVWLPGQREASQAVRRPAKRQKDGGVVLIRQPRPPFVPVAWLPGQGEVSQPVKRPARRQKDGSVTAIRQPRPLFTPVPPAFFAGQHRIIQAHRRPESLPGPVPRSSVQPNQGPLVTPVVPPPSFRYVTRAQHAYHKRYQP